MHGLEPMHALLLLRVYYAHWEGANYIGSNNLFSALARYTCFYCYVNNNCYCIYFESIYYRIDQRPIPGSILFTEWQQFPWNGREYIYIICWSAQWCWNCRVSGFARYIIHILMVLRGILELHPTHLHITHARTHTHTRTGEPCSVSLSDILSFFSGAERIPAVGFDSTPLSFVLTLFQCSLLLVHVRCS